MLACEQHVEQQPELIHIGSGRRQIPEHLLRSGVFRSQRGFIDARRVIVGRRIRAQQLRDAEIEQLHLAVARHEYVRGLEIAVNDEVTVRVRHRRDHVYEQAHAIDDRQRLRLAIVIDARTIDIFQRQERHTVDTSPCIEKSRNVRMSETRKYLALQPEPIGAAGPAH